MGKARGPRRKEGPARKRPQVGNSGLLHKAGRQHPKAKGAGTLPSAGLEGNGSKGKRSSGQQFLLPNKRARVGKRRRRSDGPLSQQPRSSEAAAIRAEYAAVDAREKAKRVADDARGKRTLASIELAPASAGVRFPSEGDPAAVTRRSIGSAGMIDALLDSIADDPAPAASAPSRPVRGAGRKRGGNPYAALGDQSDSDADIDNAIPGDGGVAKGASSERMTFAPPSRFAPSSWGSSGWGRVQAGSGLAGPDGAEDADL